MEYSSYTSGKTSHRGQLPSGHPSCVVNKGNNSREIAHPTAWGPHGCIKNVLKHNVTISNLATANGADVRVEVEKMEVS
jgi:hypothetical protein